MNLTDVNWDAARFAFDLAQTLFMAGVAIYVWWTNRSRATKKSIEEVDQHIEKVATAFTTRANALERRVDGVEKDLSHLPSHDELGALHEKVNGVANTMNQVQGELRGINTTLNLINEFLINKRER
jgi:ABC-type transporter Mla subunit MlaD